jgi:hypothetical protein
MVDCLIRLLGASGNGGGPFDVLADAEFANTESRVSSASVMRLGRSELSRVEAERNRV